MRLTGTAATALGLMAFGGAVHAEAPPAGTIIGNQAIATFNDGTQSRSVTSNLVQTEINQVYAVDIEAPQTKSASVDGLVTFPHTITNTGNGADSFTLTAAGTTAGDFDSISIYADADCDGVPDSATVLATTPSLAAGEAFCVVVEADVSAAVLDTQSADFNITATSVGDNNVTDLNNDIINVTSGPILGVTKSVVLATDADGSGSITPGDTLTFRLTYSNSQPDTNATAYIVDDLDSIAIASADLGAPTNFVWSDGGTLDEGSNGFDEDSSGVGGTFNAPDATNGSGERIDVFYDTTTGEVQIGVDINSGSLTRQGYVEFDVIVGNNASGTPVNVATIDTVPSNQVPIPISRDDTIALVLNDSASTSPLYADRSDTDFPDAGGSWTAGTTTRSTTDTAAGGAIGDDIIEFGPTVAEGSVVPFEVILTNHSNTDERFNLTGALDGTGLAGGQQFPAGTTFTFYTTGGSPLLDVDGNGIPDILVGANSAIAFEVRADLPLGFTANTPAGNGGTDAVPAAQVTATSSSNLGVSNSTVIQLAGGVQGASVDIENRDGSTVLADGPFVIGAGPSLTLAVDPGQTATFIVPVENTSLAPDSYNLSFSDSLFTPGTLPADWTVVFRNSAGAIVTNTGIIAAASKVEFTAEVTVPEGQAPGGQDIYFRATSATNNAVFDTKLDQVTVNTVADLAITPDRQGQIAAGGALVLSHTLTNVGNVPIRAGDLSQAGFSSLVGQLYVDVDQNGIFDLGTDVPVTNINQISDLAVFGGNGDGDFTNDPGFAPTESVTIFNRVQASATAVAGLSESAIIEVGGALTGPSGAVTDVNANNNTVTDTVTIVSGDLDVLKLQALDTGCDGADGSFETTQLNADPGDCIVYQVTAENTGTAVASDVKIIDTTPAFTTYFGSANASTTGGGSTPTVNAPTAGSAGDLSSEHGNLSPGAVATLEFTVQIDQ